MPTVTVKVIIFVYKAIKGLPRVKKTLAKTVCYKWGVPATVMLSGAKAESKHLHLVKLRPLSKGRLSAADRRERGIFKPKK